MKKIFFILTLFTALCSYGQQSEIGFIGINSPDELDLKPQFYESYDSAKAKLIALYPDRNNAINDSVHYFDNENILLIKNKNKAVSIDFFNVNSGPIDEFSYEFITLDDEKHTELFVLRFNEQEYGSRGGTDYKWYQVWSISESNSSLLFEAVYSEAFAWFSYNEQNKDDAFTCTRNISIEGNIIKVGIIECDNDDVSYKKNREPSAYRIVNGAIEKIELDTHD